MTDAQLFPLWKVAEKTGLSLRGLSDGARAGKFQHHRIQGRRYMTQEQIDMLLRESLTGPPAAPVPLFDQEAFKARFLGNAQRP